MGHLIHQFLRGPGLFHGRPMQLPGLAVQLLCHFRQTVSGRAEAQNGVVQGTENGAEASLNLHKVSLVLHLGRHLQISLRHLGQYPLNIRYVTVDAFHGIPQRAGKHFQFVPGPNPDHFRMEIPVGQSHHPVRHLLHRTGDGPGQAQHQQHGNHQYHKGCRHRHQNSAVDIGAVIRLGHLNHQGPLGSPNGGKGCKHGLLFRGELCRAGLVADHPDGNLLISPAQLFHGLSLQNQILVRMPHYIASVIRHVGNTVSAQINAADDIIQGIVFIDAYHIQNSLPVFLDRHSHGDAQSVLKSCR